MSEGPHATPSSAPMVMALVVVLYGMGPPIMKAISAPPLVAATVRTVLAVPVVVGLALATGRRVTATDLRRTAVAGLLLSLNLVLVFGALPHISIAVLSVILALQPGVILLVAGRWLGERATGWHVLWTAVGVVGVGVVIAGGDPAVRGNLLGVGLGTCALLTYTAYYVLNRRIRVATGIDPLTWLAAVSLVSAVAILPFGLTASFDGYREIGGSDWSYLVFIIVLIGAAHIAMSWVHRYIPAVQSSLYLLAMNLVSVLAAWPMHDEPVSLVQVLGGVVVLGAVGAVILRPAVTVEPAP